MKEITLKAEIGNIPQVIAFIEEQLEKVACPLRAQMQIDVAVDELFSNIVRYAYSPGEGPATVRVDAEEEPRRVVITFIDHGKPYNPLTTAAPDMTLAAKQRHIGGLGVFMVKKTMDDVAYEYRDGMNILTIRKKV